MGFLSTVHKQCLLEHALDANVEIAARGRGADGTRTDPGIADRCCLRRVPCWQNSVVRLRGQHVV